jgi:hypothetical protein
MDENTQRAPADEEYQNVERVFLQEFNEAHHDDEFPHSHNSQYHTAFKHLIPRIRRSAEKGSLQADEYYSRLREAEEVVDDLAFALSAHWRKKKGGWIWFKPGLDSLKFRPDDWDDVSPVDKSSLDTATARYLQRPWMQLNLLDWYILNGYIFDETARLADGIKSGEAIGIINWAHVFSGGGFQKTFYWRAAFEISKFLARWILVPAIIITAYYAGYYETAKWIAIFYGVYLIIHVTLFPRRHFRRKALTKGLDELESKLNALISIYQSSSPEVFNPSRLRDLIAKNENKEVLLRPVVYSILDRAIDRDAAVFAVEGRG